jgi:hypothetical protein
MPKTYKPFSVLDEIRRIESPEHMRYLAGIIRNLEIRTGHDKIVEAWRERMEAFGIDLDLGVPEAVLAQKPNLRGMSLLDAAAVIAEEVKAMTDEEVHAYIKEHGLEHLVAPDRIEALFRAALAKRGILGLVWDKDKAENKDEDPSE